MCVLLKTSVVLDVEYDVIAVHEKMCMETFCEHFCLHINPTVPRPFLEVQYFFSEFWRRMKGGRNYGHRCIM